MNLRSLMICWMLNNCLCEWNSRSVTLAGGGNVLKDRVVGGQAMSLFPSQLLSAVDKRFSQNSRKMFFAARAALSAASTGGDGSFNYKHNFTPSVNWHHQYSPPLWYFNWEPGFHTQCTESISITGCHHFFLKTWFDPEFFPLNA